MKVEITYPHVGKRKHQRQDVIYGARWMFWLSAVICATVNILTGGPAWTFIFLWTLWAAWSFVIAPDLVEYNRLSFCIRAIIGASVLLIILDALFSTRLTIRVVPIVCFSGLVLSGFLLFTDLNQQKQNMMPLLTQIAVCLAFSIGGMIAWQGEKEWALMTTAAVACGLLVLCFVILRSDFIREIKKRFHVK